MQEFPTGKNKNMAQSENTERSDNLEQSEIAKAASEDIIFVPRYTAPSTDNPNYYSDRNPFYAYRNDKGERTLAMPNCTAYAYGRLLEITGRGFDELIGGDARTWYGKAVAAGLETGQEPRLGAVCCWNVTDGGAGHISMVEKVEPNGDIVTSNSAYGGPLFYTATLTKASDYYYAPTRKFEGFIYCGIDFDEGGDTEADVAVAGKEVKLYNTPCYSSETIYESYGRRTGTYYLWDNTVINGRIRITNLPSRVGIPGQVTCWISIADVGLVASGSVPPVIKTGKPYVLDNVKVYDSEIGPSIGRRTGTYYVWSIQIVNGRIRMTNREDRTGVPGQVSFWVDGDMLEGEI